MGKTVPVGAALLLDFIGGIEAPRGYNVIYGNNQDKLPKPITQMTIGELIVSGQPMALDLKFQGIRASISVTGQPFAMRLSVCDSQSSGLTLFMLHVWRSVASVARCIRGGSVCLDSFGRLVKWISASVMPPPSSVPAR
ncbi:hypothetical protein D3C80_1648970 [compost metagenome]